MAQPRNTNHPQHPDQYADNPLPHRRRLGITPLPGKDNRRPGRHPTHQNPLDHMNVLYLHQHFSVPQGAAGLRSYAMAQQLIAQGHTVTIICGSYRGGYTGLRHPFHKGQRQGTVDGIHLIEYDLAYANGLDAVLNTAAELQRRQRYDITMLLIDQGQCKPALQARAQQAGLDNVIFHDPVDKQRLAGLFASTDLGLQILANIPAFYDGTSPNKYFDYLAAGLPVFNNYSGWLAEHIQRHQHGYAIVSDDPSAFADALEHAANHRYQLNTYRTNSRALACQQFDRHQLAKQWVQWLEQAASC